MIATTRALHMVQDGSFWVQSGASSAEISRTIPDPADRDATVADDVVEDPLMAPPEPQVELRSGWAAS